MRLDVLGLVVISSLLCAVLSAWFARSFGNDPGEMAWVGFAVAMVVNGLIACLFTRRWR